MLKDDSQTESKAGRNPQVTVDLRRHLVREPPGARMLWKRIEQTEGDKMAHLEDLRGLNQQSKATPLSGSALRLIHPYSNLYHVVDVCPSFHSFILNIYIAPLQENYSEALPTPARSNKAVLR